MNFLEATLANPLLQAALLGACGASIASGIIGSYVVVKRILSLSGSIAHSVLGGMGCALWLQRVHGIDWFSPLYGALIASILSALIIGWVHLYYREREDAIIAMVWTVGMAVGVIFVAMTPGYNVELTSFLLGNILWVGPQELLLLGILDGLVLASVLLFHKQLRLVCFDEKEAILQGIPVIAFTFCLLILVAISVVLLIHLVGIILALAMLALPASIAGTFTRRLSTMMVLAVILNAVFSVGGLALAYRLDWPVGATIALFAGFIYLLHLRFKRRLA